MRRVLPVVILLVACGEARVPGDGVATTSGTSDATVGGSGGAPSSGGGGVGAGAAGGSGGSGGSLGECPDSTIALGLGAVESVELGNTALAAPPDLSCPDDAWTAVRVEIQATGQLVVEGTLVDIVPANVGVAAACDGEGELACAPGSVTAPVSAGTSLFVFGPVGAALTLRLEGCGDGVVQAGEACDDGNTDPNDACDACEIVCGCAPECPPDNPVPGGLSVGFGFDAASGHCYMSYGDNTFGLFLTFAQSRDICLAWGGDLAVPSTLEEIGAIELAFAADELLYELTIGGIDSDGDDVFEWITGEAWTYPDDSPPWYPGSPIGGDQDYIEFTIAPPGSMFASGFNDDIDQSSSGLLCERAPPGAVPIAPDDP